VTIDSRDHLGGAFDNSFNLDIDRQGADVGAQSVYVGTVAKTRVMYVKDLKPSGTNGQTLSVGWNTRNLNSISGDIFGSLNSDTITLPKGTYYIQAESTSFANNRNKIRLVGDPNGTPFDAIIGLSVFSQSSVAQSASVATLQGTITISSSTEYEIQHYATVADFGGSGTSVGIDELFTVVTITKLK
jgi:hypothetical protein